MEDLDLVKEQHAQEVLPVEPCSGRSPLASHDEQEKLVSSVDEEDSVDPEN